MMRIAKPSDRAMPVIGPGEIEDAGRERQQHVKQRAIGARIGNDVEKSETALSGVGSFLGKGPAMVASISRYSSAISCRRSVGLDDGRQDFGFVQFGIVRDLVVQMVFRVGERVADQSGGRAFQRAPQRIEIGADRFRRTV